MLVLFAELVLLVATALPFIEGAANPCVPNPCGANTQCYVASSRPVCSCLAGYYGDPLTYCQKGECTDSNDCPSSHTCQYNKCVNVCAGQCGLNADCFARNHVPVCTCPARYTGDPLTSCRQMDPQELCHPSPCGANTQCNVVNDVPTCTCLPGYFGSPLKGCHHECESDYDCGPSQACKNYQCSSVCTTGACAPSAICEARNHRAVCTCPPGYFGDPFVSCRAECEVHEDCPLSKPSCLAQKCVDPCAGACGVGADCRVRDRTVAVCSCPKDMTGNPFVRCRPFEKADLCEPNPCGQNAKCQPGYDRSGKERPVCTCLPGFVGDALRYCRPGECQSDAECRYDQNCLNNECKASCTNQCGENAVCNARNHIAVCSCPPGYTGDALSRCYAQPTASDNTIYRAGRRYYY